MTKTIEKISKNYYRRKDIEEKIEEKKSKKKNWKITSKIIKENHKKELNKIFFYPLKFLYEKDIKILR